MGGAGDGTGARDGGRSCGGGEESWVVGEVVGAMDAGMRWGGVGCCFACLAVGGEAGVVNGRWVNMLDRGSATRWRILLRALLA